MFQSLWLKRLKHKFQNTRIRKEQSLDVIKMKKEKYGAPKKEKTVETGSTSTVNAEFYGRANYTHNPKKPESEDGESTKRHMEWLKKSCILQQDRVGNT